MFSKEIKRYYVLLFISVVIIFSCKNNEKEIKKETAFYKQYSTNIINKNTYQQIYSSAIDSLNLWSDNNLRGYIQLTSKTWQLDSLLCFNKDKNKCVMSILVQNGKDVSNAVDFFYGVKIHENWYFFSGATAYPTPYNDKGVLSFEKLHEIAMKEVFSGYLIKDEKGNWVINDKFFEYHFKGSGWGCGHLNEKGQWVDTCSDKQFEQLYLKKAESVWQK